MPGPTEVHVVLPAAVADVERPSGGNRYVLRLGDALAARGHRVVPHPVPGDWPWPDAEAYAALDRVLHALPEGAPVLVDGLLVAPGADLLVPAADRLRLTPLLQMPLAAPPPHHPVPEAAGEAAVARVAHAVVVPSDWARAVVLTSYGVAAERVHVAAPGTDPAAAHPRSDGGGRLLTVAVVAPHKGQDVLLDALSRCADLGWSWTCVGALHRDPGFVEGLRDQVGRSGLTGRVRFLGPRTGPDLDEQYAAADLLVLPTWGESFGMVVTEALAHGVPVLASDVGGVPEALGRTWDGRRPGLLVPAGDPVALAEALRTWWTDDRQRAGLRAAAADRRRDLPGWDETARRVAAALADR